MYGPKPRGHWSQHSGNSGWGLTVGQRYRVKLAFTDYDRDVHPVGETWTFAGYGFLPYDDGLSLFVLIDNQEWHIRLQVRPEEQAEIAESLATRYIERVSGGGVAGG